MVTIRALGERDLPEAQRIIHRAFGTFLGVPDLEKFWFPPYAHTRFGAEHIASFAAERDGRLLGSNFVTKWGSVGFFGPLSTRPELWDAGIGQRLVAAVSDQFQSWGIRHAGLFTFAQSAKHVGLYGKFGFHPRFLTAIMTAPVQPAGAAQNWSRYSELTDTDRTQAESASREVTEQLYDGLDLRSEIRTVDARKLGDTVLLWDGGSRLAGFAICHCGPESEAGESACFVKFGVVRPGAGVEDRFAMLLDSCAALAAAAGMTTIIAGVNTAREEAYRAMLARGFRTQIQGVTMHRPNEPGYSRPGLFVLDDWR
ncbi:MAG: GNAT family N-acetyltransferase [Alphaproteobacteria bacterium]|nr:GNAT family N-acetyltransferase [Alphaproteobacteria bacterium]MBV9154444.1 GNAT family N-acetyltransferase [Alphaproteobacteria bacterium]